MNICSLESELSFFQHPAGSAGHSAHTLCAVADSTNPANINNSWNQTLYRDIAHLECEIRKTVQAPSPREEILVEIRILGTQGMFSSSPNSQSNSGIQ